ncbi:MAG: serine hydrolase [Pseudohongiellaceae bacterium]
MNRGKLLAVFMLLIVQAACVQMDPIQRTLGSDSIEIRRVMSNLAEHEVQILFSEISRNDKKEANFSTSEFQVDSENYFYPASTVKFLVALLALEKINEDPRVDRHTSFTVAGELEATTFTDEITALFVVSDNDAYNRLFEFLGKDEINRRLISKGIEARLSHRLSIPDSDRLDYRALHFSTNKGTVISQAPASTPIEKTNANRLTKGIAYRQDGELVERPFDFAEKNSLPLRTLHESMKRLVFPENFTESERFKLTQDDRQFLLKTMKTLPAQAGFLDEEYYDSYVKFLVFGDRKTAMPAHIEIYNKVGYAYGTLTDCAYIVDTRNNKEYLITATLLVNDNQIFNDDNYEYDSIGIPFLAELGRQLIQYDN